MAVIYKNGVYYGQQGLEGHIILDSTGNPIQQRPSMKFGGDLEVQDNNVDKSTDVLPHLLTTADLDEIFENIPDPPGTGFIKDGPGYHNSVYRGKYLGDALTTEQKLAISTGTFKDLYIGDYWTIGGINYRIAAFDYWYNTGDTACTTHHVVIVPDTCVLNNVKMNDTNIVTGAYIGSKMYTTYIAPARTTCINAFGSANILTHREYFANAVTGNPAYESAGAWYDSKVDLMNEQMVYGCKVFQNHVHGANWSYDYTIDKSQLPLFGFRHDLIGIRAYFWFRCVASSTNFSIVTGSGYVDTDHASSALGVRPAFGVRG